jgi:pyruvate,orthophosphate dikinase
VVIDVAGGRFVAVRAGGRTVPEGALIAIDGTGGEVVLGRPRIVTAAAGPHLDRLLEWADEVSGDNSTDRDEAARLGAAHAVLRRGASIP